jgi:hypothetical protein
MRSPRWVGFVALGLFASSASALATGRDDEKRACMAASEEAQVLRLHDKLRAAKDQLLVCARDVCPPVISHDCGQWLTEVNASLPTVVLSVLDAAGNDVAAVRVEVDGAPFVDRLGGTALPADPGEHTFVFFHGSDPPIVQKVIVREGEKNRLLSVRLSSVATGESGAPRGGPRTLVPAREAREGSPEEGRSSAMPILAWSLLGASAVGLGFGAYFEVTQVKDYGNLSSTCAPTHSCSASSVDTVTNDRVYGFVSLSAGLVAAGVGTTLLLLHHSRPGTPSSAWFDVAPSRRGGAALVGVSF